MNAVHVHLMLNHIPVLGAALAVLLLAWDVLFKRRELRNFTLVFIIFIALVSVPAFFSGQEAEEIAENLPQASETLCEEHEESAEWSLGLIELSGILAIAGLILVRKNHPAVKWTMMALFISALVSAAAMGRTAYLGGQIIHSEIRDGAQAAVPPAETEKTEKDD